MGIPRPTFTFLAETMTVRRGRFADHRLRLSAGGMSAFESSTSHQPPRQVSRADDRAAGGMLGVTSYSRLPILTRSSIW